MKFFGLKPVLKTSLIRIRLSLIRTRLSLIRSAYKPYRKPTPKSSLKRGKDLGEGRSKVKRKTNASLAIVVVNHNEHLNVGHQGLNLVGKHIDKCCFVVNGDVGHYVNG